MTYVEREIIHRLSRALAEMPVVVLTGMRQVGKTTLLRQEASLSGRRYLSLDDFATLEASRRDPEALLAGTDPLTIDEVQRAPDLLRVIKNDVDRKRVRGRYLLSGSANLSLLSNVTESLAGRAIYLVLHPMHRREIDRSGGIPFVKRLFESGTPPERAAPRKPLKGTDVLRGGMPSVVLGEVQDAGVWFRGYEQTYLERDVRDLARIADLTDFRTLLRLVAFRTAQILNQSELGRDARLAATTTNRYLALLEASFIAWRLPAYRRSRAARLIKSPKLYFADSGLAAYLAGVTNLDPGSDEPLAGPLLETYVHQNLSAMCEAAWPEAVLHYWHVQSRYEVDFVFAVGRDTLAVEVKNGSKWSARDIAGLKAFMAQNSRCRAGILAYSGSTIAPIGERLWAVPIPALLS